jgi:broad specificity phosphatase PhoE
MTRILLIRHAHHDAIGHYLAGIDPGLHLNDDGKRQAEDLAARLRAVPLTAVVSSPLERAQETAEPIARDHDLVVKVIPDLIEFEVGEWTGASFTALDADKSWRRFNTVRSLTRPPGGELMVEVQLRAINALLQLHSSYPTGTVAAVSHGDVIRAALMYLLAIPIDFVHRFEISPGGISIVELDDETVRVLQVNGDHVPAGI